MVDINVLDDLVNDLGEKRRNAVLHPEASWRRMLVIQPPPLSLSISRNFNTNVGAGTSRDSPGNGEDGVWEAGIAFPDGLTMGALYDVTVSLLTNCPDSGVRLYVTEDMNGWPNVAVHHIRPHNSTHATPTPQTVPEKFKTWSPGTVYDITFKPSTDSGGRKGRGEGEGSTALTLDRGGVPGWEFDEWRRVRAPLGSLMGGVF